MIDWFKSLVRDEIARASRRPSPAHVGVVVELAQAREMIRVLDQRLDAAMGLIADQQVELHEQDDRIAELEGAVAGILQPEVEA